MEIQTEISRFSENSKLNAAIHGQPYAGTRDANFRKPPRSLPAAQFRTHTAAKNVAIKKYLQRVAAGRTYYANRRVHT